MALDPDAEDVVVATLARLEGRGRRRPWARPRPKRRTGTFREAGVRHGVWRHTRRVAGAKPRRDREAAVG